jgi:16S rRNA (guanine527-N7)-methyltransferase
MDGFTQSLASLSHAAGLPLPPDRIEKMAAFYALLEEANRSFNLTSIEGPEDCASRHFMDSLALPALNLLYPGDSLIDVGTGAGFPGVPIAILRQNLRVTLLDSMKKRTAFLESAVRSLCLGNVTVVTARAEDYARGAGRERFDAAVSRAVAPLNVLLEYMLPFLKPGGRALAWKGPAAAAEIAGAGNASRILGGGVPGPHGYSLAGRDTFYIVEVEKLKHTPLSFPRKAGKPASIPLK